MRLAVLGATGQLGRALQSRLPTQGHGVIALSRPEWDISDPSIIARLAALEPDAIVNAAAMTHVDGCERQPELAFRINALGAEYAAVAAAEASATLVQVSTDYVFDGALGTPYPEDAEPNPLSVYGTSKLEGEQLALAACPRTQVVRTAWLYGLNGTNFVTRIIQLADERGGVSVVTTEVGSPTFADDLADAIGALVQQPAYGVFHLVNTGQATRFEFAQAILAHAGRSKVPLTPISHFPRAARPPAFAPLTNTRAAALGITLRPWQEALRDYFTRRAIEESRAASGQPGRTA